MTNPSYTINRATHGFTVSGVDGRGIPVTALSEVIPLCPNGNLEQGIAHHLKYSGHPDVVLAIATKEGGEAWSQDIEKAIAHLPAQERWWKGLDVGTSSGSIFAVLADEPHKSIAAQYSKGSHPHDAGDLGRCIRLLEKFPEWKARLPEVAAAYPAPSPWPSLIKNWDILLASGDQMGEKLKTILNSTQPDIGDYVAGTDPTVPARPNHDPI